MRKSGFVLSLTAVLLVSTVSAFGFVVGQEGQIAKGHLFLTFDDAIDVNWRYAVPILQDYGYPAIAFYQTNGVFDAFNKYVTAGWEIGCHGYFHRNLNTLSNEQLYQEIVQPKLDLEAKIPNINKIATFAYPYGAGWNNSTVLALVNQHYNKTRPMFENWYHERTFDVSYQEVAVANAQKAIDFVMAGNDAWLMFHAVSDIPTVYLTISTTTFRQVLDIVRTSGIQPTTWTQLNKTKEPKTWVVDDDGNADFHRIQAAIGVATSEDTIFVKAGTYRENLLLYKSLSLIGEDQISTIIEGGDNDNVTEVTACNVTIKGFTIKNSGSSPYCNGISLASNWNVISNNKFENNSGRGIELVNSHDNVITENEFAGNFQGIRLENSDNNTICLNEMAHNGDGLIIEGSKCNNITWNHVEDSSEYGVILRHSSGNLVEHNNVSDSRIMGLTLCNSSENVLRENRLSGNQYNFEIIGSSEVQGFLNDVDKSNTVNGAPIRCVINQRQLLLDGSLDSSTGYLGLINCENITVKNLQLKRNGQGILIVNSTHIRAENITVSNNMEGIRMHCTNESILLRSTITDNEYGVVIDQFSYRNLVAENNISDNACGIALRDSCNNEVTQNYISRNGEALSICSSNENRICKNNFQNNTKELEDSNSDATTWNSDSPKMGNYWNHLNLPDEDKDKTGDYPYCINENNTDPYPLIYPYEFYNPDYVPKTDMNRDGVVNIVDVTMVAKAFACKPGDSRWIPTADMDKNEIIDIIDLSKVAKDFSYPC